MSDLSDRDGDQRDAADRTRRGLPKLLRIVLGVLLIAVAIVILFVWVFPWVESIQQDPTIGSSVVLRSVVGLAPH